MTERASSKAVQATLVLTVIAALCTGIVAITRDATHERIAANQQAFLERSLSPALAGTTFDNHLLQSALLIQPSSELPGDGSAIVYRAWLKDTPVAALFVVTAPDGYSGPIRILIGITASGEVTAVRILEHRETPGLGDGIEANRSDWIHQFAGHSLLSPPVNKWAIQRDGGDFEQLTGASVTPRAVVKAIRETLQYFNAHHDEIFSTPPRTEESAE